MKRKIRPESMSPHPPSRISAGLLIGILLIAFITAAGCTGTANQTTTSTSAFETELEKITTSPAYANASWGLIVVNPATGKTLYAKNADQMFVPASATKIFTSAAVLETLGPDYRITTPVYATMAPGGSGNEVDLVLVAKGDPTMGGRTLPDGTIEFMNVDHSETDGLLTTTDPLAGLNDLARQVKASGITKISDVVIDDRLFANYQGEYMDLLSPIIINDNRVDLSVTPGAPGATPTIVMRPKSPLYRLDNRVTTGPAGSSTSLDAGEEPAGTIVVIGTIAADAGTVNTTASVLNPAVFARTLFIEALERQGVDVAAETGGANPRAKLPQAGNYENARKVAELTSPPLSEDVKLTLKVSQNMHANYYVMLMALSDNQTGFNNGMDKENQVFQSLGLDTGALALGDGAGGDRVDHVSPRTAAQLLTLVSKRPYGDTFAKAMPVLGVDGTLEEHCKAGNTGCGHVYAKTGTSPWPNPLNGETFLLSKALAGYVDTKSGDRLVFAVIVNNVPLTNGVTTKTVGIDLGSISGLIYEYY